MTDARVRALRWTLSLGAALAALLGVPVPTVPDAWAVQRCHSGHRVERCTIGGVRGTRQCKTRCEPRAPTSSDGWFCHRDGSGWRCTLAMP